MATSELNQILEDVDKKVLECTICFTRFQNPKLLNCFHSFCLACLEDWVKVKGKLTCPTCSKSYPLPEGGLQKLQPNTFLDNLLETIEQLPERDQIKCVCKKENSEYYCQECRQYLCSACSDYHKEFRLFANHKLHSMKDVRSMSPIQKASLHPPQCLHHTKPLEFYCASCKIPVCDECAIKNHNAWEGKHKSISISEAFQTFKETSSTLEEAAQQCKNKLQDCLQVVTKRNEKFGQSKDKCLRDIDEQVQLMIRKIEENGEKIKSEVETIYKAIKKVNDKQMDELKATISDINTKLIFLNQLLKSNEVTAIKSSETVITALEDKINVLPETDPNNNGEFRFHKNQHYLLQQCDIGYISIMRAEDCFTLMGEESVSQGQVFVVKVIKTDEYEIQANQLKVTWTQPTGETNITQVQQDETGDYFVTGKCLSPGVCKLDVSTNGKPIKQSPMIVKVEKEGLVNTIQLPVTNYGFVICDIVKSEDDRLLVTCSKNEILKYMQSGVYIGKIILPEGVQVNRIFKMKNGNIAFSDVGNKCISVCNMNGQVVKSIGQGVLKYPSGIHVDEASNVVYVGDWHSDYVFMFDIDNNKMKNEIGSKSRKKDEISSAYDVTRTNQGHLLILYHQNQGLQLFDHNGWFLKVLVEVGQKNENGKVWHPRGVVVDEDDNIIISSEHKLQLFSSDGTFIKRIDKPKDGISHPQGVCIISHHPRRVAVANCNRNVKIFNY